MSFEGQDTVQSYVSPGGFEFGVQGWVWGAPIPRSITFFLDGSAMVCDQYGRQVRKAILNDGREIAFADRPPEANQEGAVVPRPQFATHFQVVYALRAEKVDWLSCEVVYRDRTGREVVRGGFTAEDAVKVQKRLIGEGHITAKIRRSVVCAGWPQLPYDELKELPEMPPTPEAELMKIPDPQLRKDALRFRAEAMTKTVEEE